MTEDKEWVKATRPVNGPIVVTVTRMRGSLTAKYSVKAYSAIKASAAEARKRATEILDELQEALADGT